MENILKKAPGLGKHILRNLDHKILVTTKLISKNWMNYIDNDKYFWVRMILDQIGYNSKFLESWKKVLVKTPTKLVREMAFAVDQLKQMSEKTPSKKLDKLLFYRGYNFSEICKWSPLHIFAISNSLQLYQYVLEKMIDKSPITDNGITPFFIPINLLKTY